MNRTNAPKTVKIGKATKKPKKPRKYNNTARMEKSNNNRQKIIENYVALLVEKHGEDLSLEELAERAELSTRTLFRFFGDKKSLTRELETYLENYVTRVSGNLSTMTLEEFSEFSFKVFDEYERLILAYLYTNFGQQSRVLFRRRFNALILEKMKERIPENLTPEQQSRVHLLITLINANIWSDLRSVYGETGEQMGQSIKWAISTLLSNIVDKN